LSRATAGPFSAPSAGTARVVRRRLHIAPNRGVEQSTRVSERVVKSPH
jgi:hypothetical protein